MMGSRVEYTRGPYLEMVTQDAGGAFCWGVTMIGFYEFITTSYNSRTGLRERFIAGTQAVRMNTPRSACQFTIASVLGYSIEHSAAYVRQKEDPWNSIMGSFVTGGVLGMGSGPRAMAVCGILLASLDGSLAVMKRFVDQAN